jgi:ketosteroid isomerase-like protein
VSRVLEMDVVFARKWLDQLDAAWRDRDPEAAAALFSIDAIYRSHPFQSPLLGRTEIAAYWTSATEHQSGIQVTFGEPLVEGDRMAVEWWSVVSDNGRPTTDAGGLFLRFDDGRCSELREYWNLSDEAIEVPEGWGR